MFGLNPWVLLGTLIAFIAVGSGGYIKGRSDSTARWTYASLEAQRDELLKTQKVTEAARQADAQRMAENETLLRDLQTKAEEDAKSLEDASRECLSRDDTIRLRKHFRTAP